MNKSLSLEVNENDKIDEIHLEQKSNISKNKIWVIVEGTSDQKLFSKLLDGEHVKVETASCSVKEIDIAEFNNESLQNISDGLVGLRKVVEAFSEKTDRLLGIRDADFLRIDKQDETIKHLFITDCHDAEMMIVMCDDAFMHIVAEYKSDRLADFSSLRKELLISLEFLSGVRWKNSLENIRLNFNGLGLASFFDSESKELDTTTCLEKIHGKSNNRERDITQDEIEKLISGVDDHANLCNGHDFVYVFSMHASDGNNSEKKSIEHALRVAYRKEDFAKTELYSKLKKWESETEHQLFDVL